MDTPPNGLHHAPEYGHRVYALYTRTATGQPLPPLFLCLHADLKQRSAAFHRVRNYVNHMYHVEMDIRGWWPVFLNASPTNNPPVGGAK